MIDCYVALGGNLAGTLEAMREVVARLNKTQGIVDLKPSKLYHTSPVSPIQQPHYYNAVCRFQTSLPLQSLWNVLGQIESELGKEKKSKASPRVIDVDLLFYGSLILSSGEIILPHPKWQERLFVLAPLADVTDRVPIGLEIETIMERFKNPHQEVVKCVECEYKIFG